MMHRQKNIKKTGCC